MPKPTVTFYLRVEPNEAPKIERSAKKAGVSVNRWLRTAAMEKIDREIPSKAP
jgi:predicted HicB family RNase H-like nuclease